MLKTEADLFELVRADLAIQLEDDVTKLAESELFDRDSRLGEWPINVSAPVRLSTLSRFEPSPDADRCASAAQGLLATVA